MPKLRRKPSGRASTATSPRSDSLASLLAADDFSAAASATPSYIPRSRKKRKHRSSLEFLEGVASTNSSEGNAKGGAPSSRAFASNKSTKTRKRKLASSSLSALVIPGSAAVPHPQQSLKHQRQISPHSKSKLNSLVVKQIHPALDPKGDKEKVVVASLPGRKAKKKSVPEKKTAPSKEMSPQSKSKLNGLVIEQTHSPSKPKEEKKRKDKLGVASLPGRETKKKSVPEKTTMSPQSKSKPNSLVKQMHSPSKPKEEERKEGKRGVASLPGRSAKNKSVPEKKTEPSKSEKKSNRKTNDDTDGESRALFDSKKSPLHLQTEPSKKQTSKKEKAIQFSSESKQSPLGASYHITPKTNRATNNRHQSPEISYSPLDYRPQNNTNNANVSTPMLKSYVEQWTKPSPENNRNDSKWKDRAHTSVGQKRGEERSVNSPPKDDLDRMDDPSSSSVVSTSSNSDDDDEEGGGSDGTIEKSKQLITKASHSEKENTCLSSPPLKMNEDLELEYGRLAFLKQELERKMKMHKMDAEKINPWMYNSPIIGMGVVATNNTMAGGKESAGPNKFLLEASAATNNDDSVYQSGNSGDVAVAGGAPSREDVAFGEMAYQRIMAEQRMAESKGGRLGGEVEGAAENHEQNRQREGRVQTRRDAPYRGAGQRREEYGEECNSQSRNLRYNDENEYFDRGNTSSMRPSPKTKPKKKRKRRVVETITRVIHEESEEEGSASTGEGRHHHNYNIEPRQEEGQFSRSRKYHGDHDDKNYVAKESNAGRAYYSRKYNSSPDGAQRRGITYSYEQSDVDSVQSEGNDRIYGDEEGFRRRSSSDSKKQARKQRAPDREAVYYANAAPGSSKNFNFQEKKRQKRNQQGLNRSRFHTSQSSMLESLH